MTSYGQRFSTPEEAILVLPQLEWKNVAQNGSKTGKMVLILIENILKANFSYKYLFF